MGWHLQIAGSCNVTNRPRLPQSLLHEESHKPRVFFLILRSHVLGFGLFLQFERSGEVVCSGKAPQIRCEGALTCPASSRQRRAWARWRRARFIGNGPQSLVLVVRPG
jgi:hypothetical protein